MKRLHKIIAIVSMLLFIMILPMGASAYEPYASMVFVDAGVVLRSDKTVDFSASTTKPFPTIQVTSCTLQRKLGSLWVSAGSLTPPSYVATNTLGYYATADYSSNIPNGDTYRILAVFSAGGETVMRTSKERAF